MWDLAQHYHMHSSAVGWPQQQRSLPTPSQSLYLKSRLNRHSRVLCSSPSSSTPSTEGRYSSPTTVATAPLHRALDRCVLCGGSSTAQAYHSPAALYPCTSFQHVEQPQLPACFAAAFGLSSAVSSSTVRFAPTRVRVQHDTYIRASRAAVWALLQVSS